MSKTNETNSQEGKSTYAPIGKFHLLKKSLHLFRCGSISIILVTALAIITIATMPRLGSYIYQAKTAFISITILSCTAIISTALAIIHITDRIIGQYAEQTKREEEVLIELYKEEQLRIIKKDMPIEEAKKKLELIKTAKGIEAKEYEKSIESIIEQVIPNKQFS